MNESIQELDPSQIKIGEFLKQVRRKRNISLDVVHETTKIPLDALKAIEEDYKTRSISSKESFYYKGFVKIYAGYLNADISQFYSPVNKRANQQPSEKFVEQSDWQENVSRFFTEKRQKQIFKIVIILICVFVGFKALSFVFQHRSKAQESKKAIIKKEPPMQIVKLPVVQPTVKVQEASTLKVSSKSSTKNQNAPVKAQVKVKEPQSIPETSTTKASHSSTPVSATTSSTQAKKDLQLTVRSLQNVWLEVRVDGSIVFQGQLKEKKVETWIGKEKIEVMGKVSALEYSLNDKMIGSLGKSERNAKKVLVTKNGFSVVKN